MLMTTRDLKNICLNSVACINIARFAIFVAIILIEHVECLKMIFVNKRQLKC